MPRVIHFEIHADDPEKTAAFYQSLFGWQIKKWGEEGTDYWLISTGEEGPGINGGMVRRRGTIDGQAVIAYVCTIDVPAIDAFVAKAVELGGVLALPKMPVPGVGWLAYAKDPSGNIFGMMQADPAAA